MCLCARVCAVCAVCTGVHGCVWKSAEVRGCLRVCVLDEFSEYLLETRVNTSVDFNTYPIRIFCAIPYVENTNAKYNFG